jgi:N-acetylglucosaminyldiphosphoundecaprenol N-acetyl-beta-D-mannosaminyltransferase
MMEAVTNPIVGEVINKVTLPVISDSYLYDIAGLTSTGKRHEIQEQQFIENFFKLSQRERKSIFILGQEKSSVTACQQKLQREFPRLRIVGSLSFASDVVEVNDVLNAINSESPDVVCSILPTPQQEEFLKGQYRKLNTKIWLGAGQTPYLREQNPNILQQIRSQVCKHKLTRIIMQYEGDNGAIKDEIGR